MQQDLRAGLLGALAGALATLPMSAVMLVGQRFGLLGESPPRLMSSVALGAAGEHDPEHIVESALATGLHFDIGTINGTLFGLLANRVNPPGHPLVHGAVYGIAVWFLAYRGWMPMLKIMPPVEKDRPDRQVVMFVAHLVYGGVLALLTRRFTR